MQIGLILIVLAFPLLELAVLIKLGQSIGFWRTVLLLVATGVVGGFIVHRQGLAVARRAMDAARDGRPPLGPVVDGVLIMLAGTLLLIPGLLTDVVGLLLLIPPLRRAFARWGLKRMFAGAEVHVERRDGRPGSDRRGAEGGVVIDGEWERVEEPNPATPKPGSAKSGGPPTGPSKPGIEPPRGE